MVMKFQMITQNSKSRCVDSSLDTRLISQQLPSSLIDRQHGQNLAFIKNLKQRFDDTEWYILNRIIEEMKISQEPGGLDQY